MYFILYLYFHSTDLDFHWTELLHRFRFDLNCLKSTKLKKPFSFCYIISYQGFHPSDLDFRLVQLLRHFYLDCLKRDIELSISQSLEIQFIFLPCSLLLSLRFPLKNRPKVNCLDILFLEKMEYFIKNK